MFPLRPMVTQTSPGLTPRQTLLDPRFVQEALEGAQSGRVSGPRLRAWIEQESGSREVCGAPGLDSPSLFYGLRELGGSAHGGGGRGAGVGREAACDIRGHHHCGGPARSSS